MTNHTYTTRLQEAAERMERRLYKEYWPSSDFDTLDEETKTELINSMLPVAEIQLQAEAKAIIAYDAQIQRDQRGDGVYIYPERVTDYLTQNGYVPQTK